MRLELSVLMRRGACWRSWGVRRELIYMEVGEGGVDSLDELMGSGGDGGKEEKRAREKGEWVSLSRTPSNLPFLPETFSSLNISM